jgi:hypothetical protein
MEIDEDKIDDAVLALLWLTLHNERCAWKGFDWATTDRLHKKGLIGDPVNKSKWNLACVRRRRGDMEYRVRRPPCQT